MSDESSNQQHPESDLLAAFAESTLTRREREEVLGHLAVCARCRQMVFLAHQVAPLPEIDAITNNVVARRFWQRKWLPLAASASAVVMLAVVSGFWYGQVHKHQKSSGEGMALQQSASPAPNNANKSATGISTPQTPSATHEHAAVKSDKSATKTARANVEKLKNERLRQMRQAQAAEALARKQELGLLLSGASREGNFEGTANSPSSSGASAEEPKATSPNAIPSASVNHQVTTESDTYGGYAANKPLREEGPTARAATALPEGQDFMQVRAEGCVEQGVEAGCLIVKDAKSGRLYNVMIKGRRPAVGEGIEFVGVKHDGPTSCMQGSAFDVVKWARKSSLKCTQGEVPEVPQK